MSGRRRGGEETTADEVDDEDADEVEEEEEERNALYEAAVRIGLVEYILRQGSVTWAFLILVCVLVLVVCYAFASSTVPLVPATNFFRSYCTLGLFPSLLLLPMSEVQKVRPMTSPFFPFYGAYMVLAFGLVVMEFVFLIIQIDATFSSTGTLLSNMDIGNAAGLVVAGVASLFILAFYAPLLVNQVAMIVRYAKALKRQEGGNGTPYRKAVRLETRRDRGQL
jgi:hypothetical protein